MEFTMKKPGYLNVLEDNVTSGVEKLEQPACWIFQARQRSFNIKTFS